MSAITRRSLSSFPESSRATRALLAAAALASLAGTAQALNITVVYTAAWNNLANWNNDAALKARAEAVVARAKDNWEFAITDAFAMTVTVDWGLPIAFFNNDSQICGVGGVLTTQVVGGVTKPATAKIILNRMLLGNPPGGAAGNWFIDPTPAANEEYIGVPGEPWRGTADGTANFHPGVACGEHRNRIDMLSWTKHEFGHTLGFHYQPAVPMFPPYIAEVALDVDLDVNDFGGIALPCGALANLNDASHFDPNAIVPGVPMNHLLMVPSFPVMDARTFMSPYDVSAVALVLGLPLAGAYNLNPKDPIGCGMAAIYCTSGTTTNGCVAVTSSFGTPSTTAGSGFTLVASGVEGQKPGMIFYGITGTLAAPWGTSFLCVKAPLQRTPSQSTGGTPSGCDGSLALDFNLFIATHPGALGNPFASGDQVWAQAWFRDPPAPKTTNMSDGIAFSMCP